MKNLVFHITLTFGVLFATGHTLFAQCTLIGSVKDGNSGAAIEGAEVFVHSVSRGATTNANGEFRITDLPAGAHRVSVFAPEKALQEISITLRTGDNRLDVRLEEIRDVLQTVTVEDHRVSNGGIRRLSGLEGAAIYESKKTEVIEIGDMAANLATNNARQIYAKVPGLNIYESDGAGLQLGIGARGLDPNRTSNFNVRQNGYDISADALGYPESYYVPPTEAVERIEVVRGAASLQYGTQFGGLLNFVMKDGPTSRPLEIVSRQSLGSFGLFNSFNSVGGTKGKVRYYGFYHHKHADGWRPNSEFDQNTGYVSLTVPVSDKLSVTTQYTHMDYLARQPGGLTDAMFQENPRQSIRERNWFKVNWNLIAVLADGKLSDSWRMNVRLFGLLGARDALGNLGRIDRADDGGPRDLFSDDFTNFGGELRFVHHYTAGRNPAALVLGTRYYHGFTYRRQGMAPDGSEATFRFLNPDDLEGSNYDFPGNNESFFAENIFNLTEKLSVTPGIRFERIQTKAKGYYKKSILRPNPDTGIAEDSTFQVFEERDRVRNFLIAGVGVSYRSSERMEVYGNFSQNYRAINFNDIRVVNPNQRVDPEITDEEGFNFDLGARGGHDGVYNFDVSVFYLRYEGRIGSILREGIYRYRTNVADSRHVGIEAFGQYDLLHLFLPQERSHKLTVFGNIAVIDAVYVNSAESAVDGKEVELVPRYNIRTGLTWEWKDLMVTWQGAFTAKQYSDVSNATYTPSAVEGLIPAYHVMDIAAKYTYKFLTVETGVNNLTDNMYFTRRASGYPGPGILPSDGRNYYLTLQVKL
ncbi:MAG: TonB-dependent receptor [Bacteroidota bacterium]|jgi:Fe(3+) dicitrate transport protein|nr:MAG: iron(III) dicitrate transport protein FecA [Bacteroidota bacterium]